MRIGATTRYAALVFILALPFLFPAGWIILIFVGSIPITFALTLTFVLTGRIPGEMLAATLFMSLDLLAWAVIQ